MKPTRYDLCFPRTDSLGQHYDHVVTNDELAALLPAIIEATGREAVMKALGLTRVRHGGYADMVEHDGGIWLEGWDGPVDGIETASD